MYHLRNIVEERRPQRWGHLKARVDFDAAGVVAARDRCEKRRDQLGSCTLRLRCAPTSAVGWNITFAPRLLRLRACISTGEKQYGYL